MNSTIDNVSPESPEPSQGFLFSFMFKGFETCESYQSPRIQCYRLCEVYARKERVLNICRYFKIVNSFDNEEHSNSAIVPGANSGTYEPTPERVNFGTSHYAKSSSNPLTQAPYNYILAILASIIVICLVVAVILIVKTYNLKPIKQNLAVAMRRKRTFGKAPDNNYIAADDIRRASMSAMSDRKSLPPPEVLLAARERASQMMQI